MSGRASALRLRRLSADPSGATIVEFALIFPVLLLITMGIIQVGWLFIATQHLENAVADLGRMVRTGQVQDANLGQAEFRALLCGRMKPILSCETSNLLLDVQVVPDFGPVSTTWPVDQDGKFVDNGAYQLGVGGQVVLVRAFYRFEVWLPLVGPLLSNMSNGSRMIVSTAAFRNEPF
jgi:Flp pilus assembly protein TadG